MRIPTQLQCASLSGIMVPWQTDGSTGLGLAEYLAQAWGLKLKSKPRLLGAADGACFYVDIRTGDHTGENSREDLLAMLADDFLAPFDLPYLLALAVSEDKLDPGNYLIVNRRGT